MNTNSALTGTARTLFILSVFLVSSCAAGQTAAKSPALATPSASVDVVTYLNQLVQFDYEPYSSPQAMQDAVDYAAIGTIQGVESVQIQDELGPLGGLLVSVAVSEPLGQGQGGESTTFSFLLNRPTDESADYLVKALPAGTPIAFFGFNSDAEIVNNRLSGPLLEPAPQGLILDLPSGSVNVFGSDENSSLRGWIGVNDVEDISTALE